ncbi:MAG: ATP-binding cassette domain-containing protein [Methanomicrobiales archaeon]|nr:ATP-binding cassette domain-containing protein [Methanomicrobiales archaeon]
MTEVIRADCLTKKFGKNTVVDHVSFEVSEGEIFGFLGQNGAGKTTTTRMLTGVLPSNSGTATILGYDIMKSPVYAKQRFGVVPETSNAYIDLSAQQNMFLMGELYDLPKSKILRRTEELLTLVGLIERKDQKVQAYSKGMKQRLILAMSLIHEPELLFLDEPTSGLDVQSTHMILSLLRDLNRNGMTIFLTTHNMEEANQLCNRVGIIRAGKMIALDAPEKLKSAIDREHRIEVSFAKDVPSIEPGDLPGIIRAEKTGDKWQIIVSDKDAAIRSIVAYSEEKNTAIVTLNTLAPTLDEAFIRLTREEEK